MTTLYDFFLEIVAVFLGVFGAFLLNNYREDRAERKEGHRILSLVRTEVQANKEILEPMKDTAVGAVPNTRPMRGIWDGLTLRLWTVKNNELLSELTLLYFLQANLDRALDVYRHYAGEYQYADSTKRTAMQPTLASERDHFVSYSTKHVLPQIDKVLTLIDAELTGKASRTERVLSRNGGNHVA